MPIPQLSKPNQNWRNQKKKYYVSKTKKTSSLRSPNKNSFRNNKKKLFWRSLLTNKKVIQSLVIIFLIGFLTILIYVGMISRALPDPNKLLDRQIAQSTKIYDRTGENILYEIHGDEARTIVALDEIPDYVKYATIAMEDKNFYEHKGISWWGILRGVVWQTLKGERIQGGSTLTQQFVKNAILTPERKVSRKIKEWILSSKIEQKYSKDEILQMYFNEIPYGSTAYGVEAACQRYFGKSVKDINLAEAAIIAALPQAPSRYSPYGPNKDLLINKQHVILNLMVEQDYTTEPKAEAAKLYNLKFKKQSTNITAPHFVMLVKEMLSEKYGEKMVEQEGLKIYTTLDLYKQEIAEEVITELASKNEENYDASNASLVSIDPKTGQVLAMVGSRDYFDDEIDGQVNIATSNRQPGSSMKPLIYATMFQKGYTPNTILYDVVTNFSNNESEPYEPHNYDLAEHGPVTIRKALAGSLNIPAVKAIYLAGINSVLDIADDLGYSTLKDRNRFGLSLVLGGGEVKLLEHTNAFSAFAREGYVSPISLILKVEDKNGDAIEEYKEKNKKVLDVGVARMINNILSDNEARAYAFGASNWLTLGGRPVGAKTGTTDDYRDAWTIGYTPSIVTGVWVGNNDNSEMKRGAAGGVLAAPIWNGYMSKVLGDTPIEEFKPYDNTKTGKPILDGETNIGATVRIDRASGLLATEYTPESFVDEKIFSEAHNILYYIDRKDPLGDAPKNPDKDPQFDLWESRVLAWASEEGFASSTPPTEYDNLHTPENIPDFSIVYPSNNSSITDSNLKAEVRATANRGVNRVEYYVNNNLLYTANNFPFLLNKNINFLNNGFHNLKIRVCDDIDNCSEKSIEFNLAINNNQSQNNINVSWISNLNGLALNKIDFPFNINLAVDNPTQVAKIILYAQKKDGDKLLIINKIQPIETNEVSTTWNKIPESGNYKIFAEAIGWSGQNKKTEEVNINITNEGN